MIHFDDELHIGSDWARNYVIPEENGDYSAASVVMKVRAMNGVLIMRGDCRMNGNTAEVRIPSSASLQANPKVMHAKYDVFIHTPEWTYKIVMGKMTIIRDVSMH